MENEEQVFAQRRGNEHRKGDWMETASGRKFWPLDARPEEVHLDDVAHHLSRLNRYNGAIQFESYSVGEHAIVMAEWFLGQFPEQPFIAYQALHHDDCEAYISDMIRPLKRNMPQFVEIEEDLWHSAIAPALDLGHTLIDGSFTFDMLPCVKEADSRILRDERDQVVGRSANEWGIDHLEPLGVTLHGWSPNFVKGKYLMLHGQLRELMGLA